MIKKAIRGISGVFQVSPLYFLSLVLVRLKLFLMNHAISLPDILLYFQEKIEGTATWLETFGSKAGIKKVFGLLLLLFFLYVIFVGLFEVNAAGGSTADGGACTYDAQCANNCDGEDGVAETSYGQTNDDNVCYSAVACSGGNVRCHTYSATTKCEYNPNTGNPNCDDTVPGACPSGFSLGYCDTNCNYYNTPDTVSGSCTCGGFTYFTGLGTWTGSGYQCCQAADTFRTYSGTLTTSTSLSCQACVAGAVSGPTTYYGNGYTTGTPSSSTSLVCYYGDITCAGTPGANGASGTYCGNGYFSSSNTVCTSADKAAVTSGYCYYNDITCSDGSASNGAVSVLLYGNGDFRLRDGTAGNKATHTNGTCSYADMTCTDGSYGNGTQGFHCGNGFLSTANNTCTDQNKLTATSGVCYYADITCADSSNSSSAYSPLICGNGFFSTSNTTCVAGATATAKAGYCYYNDIVCTDGTYSNSSISTLLYGNGNYTGSLTSSTVINCNYGDITCTEGSYQNGTNATYCGNGYFSSSNTLCTSANKATADKGYCYTGDISCTDGSGANGAVSVLLFGNGNWTGTTCFYGDITCADGSGANGTSSTTLCTAGTSQCCPTDATRAEGVACSDGSASGTSYDRDTSQARCEDSTSTGCTKFNWSIGGETAGSACCGDDGGTENDLLSVFHVSMAGSSDGSDACCVASTDCVDNSLCTDTGNVTVDADANGDNDYCNSGTWYDCNTAAECPAGYSCVSNDCVDLGKPSCSFSSFTEVSGEYYQYNSARDIYYNSLNSGSFYVTVSASDPETAIRNVTFPDTVSAGAADTADPYRNTYDWDSSDTYESIAVIVCYDTSGNTNSTNFTMIRDATAPATGYIGYTNGYTTSTQVSFADGTDSGSGLNTSSARILRQSATILSNNTCGSYGSWSQVGTYDPATPYSDTLYNGTCYQYMYEIFDNVLNGANYTNSSILRYNNLPTHGTPTITPSSPNKTSNLTCNWNTVADIDVNPLTNITNWYRNNVSSMMLYLPMEGNSGYELTNVTDYSGYGNNGTVFEAQFNRTGGRVGGGYGFDGQDDYISVADSNSLDITNKGTIGLWAKTSDASMAYSNVGSWLSLTAPDGSGASDANDGVDMVIVGGSLYYAAYLHSDATEAFRVARSNLNGTGFSGWSALTAPDGAGATDTTSVAIGSDGEKLYYAAYADNAGVERFYTSSSNLDGS
ncbi:MAG: hypothetical protein HGA85_05225, partial [Nanoarchaeota archaeon]|nr:hypothetical protein [Nanoarchaeota archaeon]